MAEYIEREKIISELESCLVNIDNLCDDLYYGTGINEGLTEAISVIKSALAADIRPERHGEWFGTVCTNCGGSTSFYYDCDYCPNCGAKMGGKSGKSDG